MKIFLYFLFVLCTWHRTVSTRTLDHFTDRDLRAFIALLEEEYSVKWTEAVGGSHSKASNDHARLKASKNKKLEDTFADEVDIDLWNELNDKDIKNMPTIEDYSDEATAARWLKWYFTVSRRYRQVRSAPSACLFRKGVFDLGQRYSLVELPNEYHGGK
jgi:hypothetical protein